MNQQSGRKVHLLKSPCRAVAKRNVGLADFYRLGAMTFLALLVFAVFCGPIRAAEISPPLKQAIERPAVGHDAPYRVAGGGYTMENWQKDSFSAIEMKKRLDTLALQKKQKSLRKQKQRRAAARRKALAKSKKALKVKQAKKARTKKYSSKKKKRSQKIARRKTPRRELSKVERVVVSDTIVREPAKLQRCLKQAGYFNGVITGRLDDATLISYLVFRDKNNLHHRPNNLYDPVIQKVLFSLCSDNNLDDLNKFVTTAMKQNPAIGEQEKKSAPTIGATNMVPQKTVKNNEPVVTASLSAVATSSRPAVSAKSTHVSKKPTQQPKSTKSEARFGQVGTANIAAERSFANEVLATTHPQITQSAKSANEPRLARLKANAPSGAYSSYAVKRIAAAKTSRLASAVSPKITRTRVASARTSSPAPSSSSPYSKSLSIADLAKARPANPNTCSPQNHQPVVAMSSSPMSSSGRPSSYARTARLYDEGPLTTGAIGGSSGQKPSYKGVGSSSRLVRTARQEEACLPRDLYDLLSKTYGRKTKLSVCKQDCLPSPATFSSGQKELFAKRYDINWCGTGCLGLADPLPLQEVMKIEREARVHVCTNPQPRLVKAVNTGLDGSGINEPIRSLYNRLSVGYGNQDNIAVLIGNRNYGGDMQVNDAGIVNVSAMKALLIEQLGYKAANVIVLTDAKRGDFIRLFGRRGDAQGELSTRLRANPDAQLLIYYSGYASSSGLGMNNYLLPVDAIGGIEDKTAYSLRVLYENLRQLDARTTQLFLETSFNANRSSVVLAPNISERHVNVAPIVPVRGLAVFTAATGDQRPLIDHETGIGLFTRYLISGLAGKADERPIGNGDRIIDSVELHVHVAGRVRLAARKTLGLRQNPTLSRSDSLFLSQLSRKPRR